MLPHGIANSLQRTFQTIVLAFAPVKTQGDTLWLAQYISVKILYDRLEHMQGARLLLANFLQSDKIHRLNF
jgi:hypothetical protein